MERLIDKYLNKLERQRLARRDRAVFLSLDADLWASGPLTGDLTDLRRVFDIMNINSLLFVEPAEPYKGILDALTGDFGAVITGRQGSRRGPILPLDTETRTFFHDIPVIETLRPEEIAHALSKRKSAVVRGRGIISYGVVTPEQAFISCCSTCFSTCVKFFYDCLVYFEGCGRRDVFPDPNVLRTFEQVSHQAAPLRPDVTPVSLSEGPPRDDDEVRALLAEAGRAVVAQRLVDSYFGNISFVFGDSIFISETGSSLDELEACIDAVPLDGSSSVGITASSELSAHKRIYEATGQRAILHGHPKFAVILSMHCSRRDCDRSKCHTSCPEKRYAGDIPIVSGEIGTGPTGLLHTVPEAMREGKVALIYGHGVFTSGENDFRGAFQKLRDTEIICNDEYFRRVRCYLDG